MFEGGKLMRMLVDMYNPIVTIDQKIAELFNNNFGLGGDWSWGNMLLCALALILCVVLCGLVGLEREKRGRSAGLRTHLLVGVGSCIVMIISIYGFPAFNTQRDVARLAAGVIAGCGFLGAGAIIHNNGGIKGLTTASTIWMVMAIGLACGSMNFVLAIAGSLVVLIILITFRKIEISVTRRAPQIIMLVPADEPVLDKVLKIGEEFRCSVIDIETNKASSKDKEMIEFTFKLSPHSKEIIDLEKVEAALKDQVHAANIQILNRH